VQFCILSHFPVLPGNVQEALLGGVVAGSLRLFRALAYSSALVMADSSAMLSILTESNPLTGLCVPMEPRASVDAAIELPQWTINEC
jgi:hypothetical protein